MNCKQVWKQQTQDKMLTTPRPEKEDTEQLNRNVNILLNEWDELRCFEPMNQDALPLSSTISDIYLNVRDEAEPASTCLTPVSVAMDKDMDLSMVANKGSMTISVDVSQSLS
ncbi:PREDICTED: inositol hexakisphosphate and diphosphoinositol-pentakisphosphate kinase-like [Drosophila arizonae]|uniref:Inositol hexakisphosphate and diphosphoinositol-pentakisphosphate kinase-like n=1 Tax=Drosophila arizonae TaxID=7263 RepID=A0ABM1Q0J5_DROAR|nr:PREDICTED: inositol hexakisphosphate and diphosphoinositol-pentakisphosphate kinase-like [Drosophila arizonae]